MTFQLQIQTSLECDVCGTEVEPDDLGGIPNGWQIAELGISEGGHWFDVSEYSGDLYPGNLDGICFLAVCPGCDPADLDPADFDPTDWIDCDLTDLAQEEKEQLAQMHLPSWLGDRPEDRQLFFTVERVRDNAASSRRRQQEQKSLLAKAVDDWL